MSLHIVFSRAHIRRVNMKSMIVLLFLTVVAACAWAELEYHPQAVLHYLEMEDHEMARKVRSIVKARGLPSSKPTFPRAPSFKPNGFPTGIPPGVVSIQAPVVQRLDNAIHRINHYPADSVVCFVNTYPLDSDLSGG